MFNAVDDMSRLVDQTALIERIADLNCTPGWLPREQPLMWPEPRPQLRPAHWSYTAIKPGLLAAGRIIGTDLAERRNFVLRNPVPGNDFATTRTLVGAYQSMLPGEKARAHRHSSHALRVILESRGCYSVVDGKRTPMESGDIVLTPGGYWHGHGHDGDEQAYWFDCLDLPLVQLLEPMTAQEHPQGWERDVEALPRSPMRLTWSSTLQLLEACSADASEYFGTTVDLSTPLMPTISIRVHRWSRGWSNRPYRHYANTLYVVLRGSGRSQIGQSCFEWGFGDVIAAPMDSRIEHEAGSETVMVALSDETLMRFCGYYHFHQCD
jgi:gentisate 1,2-dioxygenase